MTKSFVFLTFGKMGGSILLVIINMLVLSTGVSSTCVHVPNEDMIEYSCVAGYPSDLYAIPERAEKIRIANMSIPRVTRETFSRFGDNLWVLTCSHCGITDIDPDALRSLVNLQQLRLDNNRIRSVKASWFEGMNYLTYLDLNYNEISNIEDGVYRNLPSLVDFRISGNRLECLNIDAMSNLGDLKRIFLSKNPDFKCPNAVSSFLEAREVDFEKDSEWQRIPQDLVSASGQNAGHSQDWRTRPIYPPSTPPYRERLISHTTEDPEDHDNDDYDYEYETPSPEVPVRVTPYNKWWLTISSTPSYSSEQWPTAVPTTEPPTNRGWPTPLPNSYSTPNWPVVQSTSSPYPTRGWSTPIPTAYKHHGRPEWPETLPKIDESSEYPTRDWPTPIPTAYKHQAQPEWPETLPKIDESSEYPNRGGFYVPSTRNYPSDNIQTSSIDPFDGRRIPDVYLHTGYEPEVVPVTISSNENSVPPRIQWSGNSAEIISETDFPPFETISTERPDVQTNSPAISGYPPNVHSIAFTTERPNLSEDLEPPSQQSAVSSQPQILDKYQQVQEPDAVTIMPIKKETDKPLPDCQNNSSSKIGASIVILTISIIVRPFMTI